ncbi:MAG: DUF4738 domain-containing protein [Prevotella sp.]|nr:DUF4738 domain-containing protein [Prevotella sp.]
MKSKRILFFATVIILTFMACSKKEKPTDIIAPKPVENVPKIPQKMQSSNYKETIDWIGKQYKININRHPDENMPLVVDAEGNKYYDNNITIKIVRPDGTTFFDKTFTKSDFASCVSNDYIKQSALLGIVFDQVSGDNLIFAASVGSPDVLSDEYVPLMLTISRMGNTSIKKDTRLDTNNRPTDDDDFGV